MDDSIEIPDWYYSDVLRSTAEAFGKVSTVPSTSIFIGDVTIELVFAHQRLSEVLLQAMQHISGSSQMISSQEVVDLCQGREEEKLESTGRSPYRILVWDSESEGTLMPPSPYAIEAVTYQGEFAASRNGRYNMAYSVFAGVLLMADHEKRVAVMAMKSPSDLDLTVVASPFRMLLVWVLSRMRHPVIHAAAVGNAAGAILLGGKSGSGKSSTALHCLEAGMEYLGDDLCAVSINGSQPEVHSLYATGKCLQEDLKYFPGLRPHTFKGTIGAETKRVLRLSTSFADQLPASKPVRAVLLPVRDSGRFGLEKCSVGMALHSLASEAWSRDNTGRRIVNEVLSGLLRKVPTWKLYLGSRREAVPNLVMAILEGRADSYYL